ncbi:MAG: GNAT family N-acetyltransferase [Bryobacterales bacterium]|nr:GNAT family N-acetyltransferase [Bryobacterales bacterium]
MALCFRSPTPADFPRLEELILASFEPVTWARTSDALFGPLNGKDWKERWRSRIHKIFETQIMLLGETGGGIAAFSSGTLDAETCLGYIDLLAVDPGCQGRGFGREMLRAMLRHLKAQGAVHAYLDCLTTNETGNSLYRSEGFVEVACHIRWFLKIP